MADFQLREATDADRLAIDELAELTADGGAVSFRLRQFVAEPAAAWPWQHAVAVVAEDAAHPGIIGSARVRVGTFRVAGVPRACALFSSLMVHPDARRRGIGSALAAWRADRARELGGPDVTLLADIQRGNEASLATAKRAWATQVLGPVTVIPISMRRRAPKPVAGLDFGIAASSDLDAFAAGHEAFAGDRVFARPPGREVLEQWLADSPVDEPVNHALVATRGGRVVAGFTVREAGRLSALEVVHASPAIRLANLALHVIPADGLMRTLGVERIWFTDGHLDDARALWEWTRWDWRDRGSSLLVQLDARAPELAVIGRKPWNPTTSTLVAVRSPEPISEGALIEPLV